MVSSRSDNSSGGRVVGLHPRGCQTWGPVLALALILAILCMDWRTTAAIKRHQHGASKNSPLSSRLQRAAAANGTASASTQAAASPPPELPPCNITNAAAAAAAPPSPAPPVFPRVVPDTSAFTAPVLPAVAKAVLALERRRLGRRVISFSLFGRQARYVEGAVDNAVLARRFWPGWTMRIYYGNGVPEQVLSILRALGVQLIRVNDTQERASSTLWRYYAATDPTVSRFIARDIDARLSRRDKAAVDEWVKSGLFFHTMHDHLAHNIPIMGGLCGAVGGLINPGFMQAAIKNASGHAWGVDQDFLGAELFPHVRNFTLDHSSYNCGAFQVADNRGFPTKREDDQDLVGNTYAPPRYKGFTHSGPCPEHCRRNVTWTVC